MIKRLLSKLGITDRSSFFAVAWQFIKFGFVGVSNTVVGLGVYYALLYFTELHYWISYAIAFVAGTINAYFWNSRFVFEKKPDEKAKPFIRSFLSYAAMGVLSVGLIYIIVDVLHISEWIAPLINICITVPVNFLLHKFWAFTN